MLKLLYFFDDKEKDILLAILIGVMLMRIDMTGKRFGMLTVIRPVGKAEDGSIIWEVVCDCDLSNPLEVSGGDLRRGRKVNCGCLHGNRADLLGKRFGKLLVTGYQIDEVGRNFLWKVKCDCGNTTMAKTRDLTSGSKKSCGCIKSPNLIGKKFGKLTVIEKIAKKRNGYHLWKALCDCGEYTEATTGHLNSGGKKSCGCLVNEYEDITGFKRNKLTVIRLADYRTQKGELVWECLCDCGDITYVTKDKFFSDHTRSCGCLKEDLRAENHHNWKGGFTPISKKLRRAIKPWIEESLKNANYKCFISKQGGKLVVHHANEKYPFYKILQETFEVAGLEVQPNIGYYTVEELEMLSGVCLKLHFKYGLGIPLKKELHAEFHETYGFLHWTKEDFEEFGKNKKGII